jgi:hypothetical protein
MPQFSQLWGDDLTTELGSNDTSVLFTDARRKHAVNVGLRQFADLTECVVIQSSVSVSSSAQEFDLNSSAVLAGSSGHRFTRLADQGPVFVKSDTAGNQQITAGDDFPERKIPFLDAAQSGWRSTTPGSPSGWYQRVSSGAHYFGLDCPADVSTSETAELLIPWVPYLSSLTSDTSIPYLGLSNLFLFHQASVHYGAHLMEKLRRDDERADRQMQLFLGYVQRYNAQSQKKGPKAVRAAKSYFRNARNSREGGNQEAPWWR